MAKLSARPWVPDTCETLIQEIAGSIAAQDSASIDAEIHTLIDENRRIHEHDCINLNPATNVLNPRAEAVLASALGSRPSLGYPGDKYEMGLEAIERIEVIAAELAAEVFGASYAEIRVASGAMSNLYAFMATTKPGDAVIVPPAAIGGHVTHHLPGAAGLYGLDIHSAPVDPHSYTVDLDALRVLAHDVRPSLITIGGSMNLRPHPVGDIRAIADEVGAWVLFDAAHLSGMFAGRAWPNPLEEGAHVMTMSTYKSLGGPASGLIVSNDAELAERIDKIAFPGLTANFDAAKSAALAITLLDWKEYGTAYAATMIETAQALAEALVSAGFPVYAGGNGYTTSHQLAIEAARFGGGQTASKRLRQSNILACGIGLPIDPVEGDMNGLRIGTPEIVRWGMKKADMADIAGFMKRCLLDGEDASVIAADVVAFRQRFSSMHYVRKA